MSMSKGAHSDAGRGVNGSPCEKQSRARPPAAPPPTLFATSLFDLRVLGAWSPMELDRLLGVFKVHVCVSY